MSKKATRPAGGPLSPRKRVITEENEEEGTWHVFLIMPNGSKIDVGSHCEDYEAEEAAQAIHRYAEA